VSRLEFAPKIDDIKVTDIKHGLGTFTPKPGTAVSFAKLKEALKKAGYTLGSAEIIVSGTLTKDETGWFIITPTQRFVLEGANLADVLKGSPESSRIELTGAWDTREKAGKSIEVITASKSRLVTAGNYRAVDGFPRMVWVSTEPRPRDNTNIAKNLFAPIRTTSPGLTVYKGGAFTPRFSYTKEHLGNLRVDRYDLLLAGSYTPTPQVQLEAELPIEHISTNVRGFPTPSDANQNRVGNLTLWGKYRFFRKVGEWGDKQAAFHFGLELPTGQTKTPAVADPGLNPFVRQQLSAINNGVAAHSELTYSHAKGRIIYGADLAGVIRGERDGYRLGHEVRFNTDLEYVLLPRVYKEPGHELFVLLESTFIHRGHGRLNGQSAMGSDQTVYYLAPGLQYTVSPRVVLEASYQIPVARTLSPAALRTDRNLLVGIRLLY
jgi:hypothetical protein